MSTRAKRQSALGYREEELPALALTAFVQKDDQRKALQSGFQRHVSKPVDPHDLTAAIASLAGRSAGDS
jgi:CheY-like chemotaxis protein